MQYTLMMVCAGVGTLSNLFPIVAYTLGCWNSDWTCSGDGMGGPMMLYALVFFIPNIVISLGTSLAVLLSLANVCERLSFPPTMALALHGLSWFAVIAFMVRY